MADCAETNNEDWKKTLRSKIITAITGNQREKSDAYKQIGNYYMYYAPASLYKYYSDRPEKLETVKLGRMWYSAPCNFNDVFDCDIVIDEKEIFSSALKMIPGKREARPGSPVWLQLKGEIGKKIRSLRSTFDNMKTTMGISCLSESNDSLLMWAHYANNHSGMCVEYELLEINKQLRFSPVPVIYSNERPSFHSINPDTIDTDSMNILIESLTSKSPEWSYEKEWRIIRDQEACGDSWNGDKKGAFLEMIRPSSVILGCAAKPEFEQEVKDYCCANKINLYQMEKNPTQYLLNKKPVLKFDKDGNSNT